MGRRGLVGLFINKPHGAKGRMFKTQSFLFLSISLLSREKNRKSTKVSLQEENEAVRECAGAARHAGATRRGEKKKEEEPAGQSGKVTRKSFGSF